jgi:hypothetical protein
MSCSISLWYGDGRIGSKCPPAEREQFWSTDMPLSMSTVAGQEFITRFLKWSPPSVRPPGRQPGTSDRPSAWHRPHDQRPADPAPALAGRAILFLTL